MFTEIFYQFLILEMLVMGVFSRACPAEHLQKIYCNNEYVFEGKRPQFKDYKGPYRMLPKTFFKGDVSRLDIVDDKFVQLFTDAHIDTVDEDEYIIFGSNKNGMIEAEFCKGILPKKFLTPFQITAVRDYYKLGCNCIHEIGDYNNQKFCKWREGFMMRDKGGCVWVGWEDLSKCEVRTNGHWETYKTPPV